MESIEMWIVFVVYCAVRYFHLIVPSIYRQVETPDSPSIISANKSIWISLFTFQI